MLRKITAGQAKEIDRRAQQEFHIPSLVLMENAGLEVFNRIRKLTGNKKDRVIFFCGRGNNAGDTFVSARHLINAGYQNIKIIVLKNKGENFSKEAGVNFKILDKLSDKNILVDTKFNKKKIKAIVKDTDLIVDGLLGIGLKGKVRGDFKKIIELINSLKKKVLSVDIPSGLDATTGKICGICVKAYETITFGLPKIGCYKKDGPEVCGKIINKHITFPRVLLKKESKNV